MMMSSLFMHAHFCFMWRAYARNNDNNGGLPVKLKLCITVLIYRWMKAVLFGPPLRLLFKVRRKAMALDRPGRTSRWLDDSESGIVVNEEWKENFYMSRTSLISLCELRNSSIDWKSAIMRLLVGVLAKVRTGSFVKQKLGQICLFFNAGGKYEFSKIPVYM